MSIKLFGVLITTNDLLKAIEAGALTASEAAIAALLTSDDADAKAVAADVQAKIDALKADTGKSGMEKLEEAAIDAVEIFTKYGFAATKDFAKAFVQTLFNRGVEEVEAIGHVLLGKLGLVKA